MIEETKHASLSGVFGITVIRGAGCNFKIVEETELKNTLLSECHTLVKNGITGGETNRPGVSHLLFPEQYQSGATTDLRVQMSEKAGNPDGTYNHVNDWETHAASATASWHEIKNVMVGGTDDAILKLQAEVAGSPNTYRDVAEFLYAPTSTVYVNDKFRVSWQITVAGVLPGGREAAAAGLRGSTALQATLLYQSSSAGQYDGVAADAGLLTNSDLVRTMTTVGASWPNGTNLWLGATGRTHGVVINGATGTYAGPVDKDLLATGTWAGAAAGQAAPANGSRVTATFEITSSS